MTRSPNRLGFGTVDGVIALAILVFGLLPGRHLQHSLSELISSKVTLSDCLFGLCFMFAWRYCFTLLNLYDKFATVSSRMRATLQGVIIMMMAAVAYYKLFHPNTLTLRAVILTTLVLFGYEINRSAFNVHLFDRLAARNPRRALIIGSGRRASKAWRAVRTRYRLSLSLLGFVDDRSTDDMPPDIARRHLGTLEDLDRIIVNEVVDLILIAMPIQSCYSLMQHAVHIAEEAGVQVLYLDDIYSTRNQGRTAHSLLFRELADDQEQYLMFLAMKRLVDIVGATIGLICLCPLLLGLSVASKVRNRGPVLSRQDRYGYRRRPFKMLTFRNMVRDTKQVFPELEHSSQVAESFFTRDDHRVTPSGTRSLRISLYDLPQLWNVLMGDMSLVGPRPMSVEDVALMDKASLTRRFSVRPGITGLWQISGRSGTGSAHWVAMDNGYIDGRSLVGDAKILARTIGAVIKGSGAM